MSSQSPSITLGQRVNPAADETTSSDLQQLAGKVLSILRYRQWLFILPVLTGALVMLAYGLVMPRQYGMRAVIERRDDPVVIRLVANSPYNYETLRRSLRFSLVGTEAVSKALEEIEGGTPYAASASGVARTRNPGRDARVARLVACLSVVILDTSQNYDLIEVRYNGNEPELGEKLLTTLKDNYIRQTQNLIVGLQQQAQKFFADEVEKRRTRASQMQAEMTQIVIEQPELAPGRPAWLNERLVAENLAVEQLSRQKSEIVSEVQAREEYLRQLDEQQKQGKSPQNVFTTRTVNNPQRLRLEAEITGVMAEIADAKTVRHMKDTHPCVEGLNLKLKQLNIEFDRLPEVFAASAAQDAATATNPWDQERSRITMEVKSWRGKLDQFEHDLARHQTERSRLETDKTTIVERQREYMLRQQEVDNLKTDLAVWQSKLEEINRAMAAESLDRGTRFKTIEECRRPSKPITPRISGTYMLSGGFGLCLGIVAVFLREIFDRSFRNPARVRQVLGVPVLETIGEIMVRRGPRHKLAGWGRHALVAAQVVLILIFACLNYVSLEDPSAYARWTSVFSTKLTAAMGMLGGHIR